MNYEDNIIKVIAYAISAAFLIKTEVMPALRLKALNFWRRYYYKKHGEYDNFYYKKINSIIATPMRPFDCLGCMTFWLCLPLNYTMHGSQHLLVGIVGFFIGSLVEGIMMRWL